MAEPSRWEPAPPEPTASARAPSWVGGLALALVGLLALCLGGLLLLRLAGFDASFGGRISGSSSRSASAAAKRSAHAAGGIVPATVMLEASRGGGGAATQRERERQAHNMSALQGLAQMMQRPQPPSGGRGHPATSTSCSASLLANQGTSAAHLSAVESQQQDI